MLVERLLDSQDSNAGHARSTELTSHTVHAALHTN